MNATGEDIQIVKRKTIKKLLIIFLCVMAFLTFFSNTINNFSLPRVKTVFAAGGNLAKEVTGEGIVVARESQYAYCSLNAVVDTVNVKAGDKVKRGQVLMTLDKQEALRQLKEACILLEKQKLALQKLTEEAYDDAGEDQDPAVKAARQKVAEKETDYNNVKALYDAGAETLSNLKTAGYGLADARRTCEEALDTYRKGVKSRNRELLDAGYDIELKQLQIDKLRYELENQYIIKAKCGGTVKEVNFKEGELTSSAKPLCVVINNEKGYAFKTVVDTDIVKYLAVGDQVDVRIKTLNGETIKGSVARIADSEEQKGKQKDLYINIENDRLVGGEAGELHINKDIGYYDLIVSNNAINTEAGSKFVWVVREKRGPLGNEYYLVKANVTVGESDSYKTAVLSGLAAGDRIVTGVEGNKAISEGSGVRLNDR